MQDAQCSVSLGTPCPAVPKYLLSWNDGADVESLQKDVAKEILQLRSGQKFYTYDRGTVSFSNINYGFNVMESSTARIKSFLEQASQGKKLSEYEYEASPNGSAVRIVETPVKALLPVQKDSLTPGFSARIPTYFFSGTDQQRKDTQRYVQLLEAGARDQELGKLLLARLWTSNWFYKAMQAHMRNDRDFVPPDSKQMKMAFCVMYGYLKSTTTDGFSGKDCAQAARELFGDPFPLYSGESAPELNEFANIFRGRKLSLPGPPKLMLQNKFAQQGEVPDKDLFHPDHPRSRFMHVFSSRLYELVDAMPPVPEGSCIVLFRTDQGYLIEKIRESYQNAKDDRTSKPVVLRSVYSWSFDVKPRPVFGNYHYRILVQPGCRFFPMSFVSMSPPEAELLSRPGLELTFISESTQNQETYVFLIATDHLLTAVKNEASDVVRVPLPLTFGTGESMLLKCRVVLLSCERIQNLLPTDFESTIQKKLQETPAAALALEFPVGKEPHQAVILAVDYARFEHVTRQWTVLQSSFVPVLNMQTTEAEQMRQTIRRLMDDLWKNHVTQHENNAEKYLL